MRLLVTGATGFIGSALVISALKSGHRVAVLAREGASWRIERLAGDITILRAALGDAAMSGLIESFGPDCVAHLAWAGVAGTDRNSPIQISNIDWSCRVLLAAIAAGCKNFVSTGSQAEYGAKQGPIATDAETCPSNLYGECKLATFRLLDRLATLNGVRFAWLRVFSTYGPGDDPRWIVPSVIRALLNGHRPALTEGRQRWDFLHVDDAARAILAACESKTASGVFNLGSGAAPPLRDTVSLIRDLIDPKLPLGLGDIPYSTNQIMHLEADTTRLANEIGWRPRVALQDGMANTIEWYRDNRWIFSRD